MQFDILQDDLIVPFQILLDILQKHEYNYNIVADEKESDYFRNGLLSFAQIDV